MSAVILDLDGTLVDSVPLHVVCWHDTLLRAGRPVPTARIHAGIGLGSSRLLPYLLGEVVEPDLAEELIEGHRAAFLDRSDTLQPTPGALALLADLADRTVPTVVATSAGGAEREALLAVLEDPDLVVADADAVSSSKPSPEPLRAAAGQIGIVPDRSVVMVGDSEWDGHAARVAGVTFIGVTCGGVAHRVLSDAGAARIVATPADLLGTL